MCRVVMWRRANKLPGGSTLRASSVRRSRLTDATRERWKVHIQGTSVLATSNDNWTACGGTVCEKHCWGHAPDDFFDSILRIDLHGDCSHTRGRLRNADSRVRNFLRAIPRRVAIKVSCNRIHARCVGLCFAFFFFLSCYRTCSGCTLRLRCMSRKWEKNISLAGECVKAPRGAEERSRRHGKSCRTRYGAIETRDTDRRLYCCKKGEHRNEYSVTSNSIDFFNEWKTEIKEKVYINDFVAELNVPLLSSWKPCVFC